MTRDLGALHSVLFDLVMNGDAERDPAHAERGWERDGRSDRPRHLCPGRSGRCSSGSRSCGSRGLGRCGGCDRGRVRSVCCDVDPVRQLDARVAEVGYDLGVMFDAPGDAWPPIWVLREMHAGAFEVAGQAITADGVSLALPIKPVAETVLTPEQKQRFLRERGLFLVDGQFDLFEAIVEPEQTYELLWPSAPEGAPPVLYATSQRSPGNPYR